MMNVEHFRQLFAYDAWANRRVWACIEPLSDERFARDLDYSVGSLRSQVLHTMAVQSWWVRFLATGELRFLDDADFPTRDLVLPGWERTETATRDYLATLTDDGLDRMVLPDHWAGRDRAPITVWQALFQVLNHGTDHRAQTLAGIDRLGGETVAQDYLFQVWEAAQSEGVAPPSDASHSASLPAATTDSIDRYRQAFAYDSWATRRIQACLDRVSLADLTHDLGYSVGSLHAQMVHMMTNQAFWVHFLTTGAVRFLDYAAFPTLQAVWERWERVDDDTSRYVESLTVEELNRSVLPQHWADRGRTPFTVRQALSQIVNHGTDHRAQTLAGIHRLGGRTVAQDFVLQVWGD